MTRGRIALGAVVLVASVSVVALVVLAVRWHGTSGGTYAPARLVTRTTVTPRRSLFGQIVTATLEVVVDPHRFVPKTVTANGAFRPFAVRAESESRGTLGRAVTVSWSWQLQCLSTACVPTGSSGRTRAGATAFTLPAVRVTAARRHGPTAHVRVEWPAFGVQSRLTPADLALGEPQVERPLQTPPVTWRLGPTVLGWSAVGLAIALTCGAAWLLGRALLRDGRPLRVLRIPAHLTPVDRALALAEYAATHGEDEESRKALERLAAELRRRGAAENADDAERIAWSAAAPTPESVAHLRQKVTANAR